MAVAGGATTEVAVATAVSVEEAVGEGALVGTEVASGSDVETESIVGEGALVGTAVAKGISVEVGSVEPQAIDTAESSNVAMPIAMRGPESLN